MSQTRGYCDDCQRYVLASQRDCNHVLHLLVSIFLCGLWLPVWLLIAVASSFEPARCNRCGARVGRRGVSSVKRPPNVLFWAYVLAVIFVFSLIAYFQHKSR